MGDASRVEFLKYREYLSQYTANLDANPLNGVESFFSLSGLELLFRELHVHHFSLSLFYLFT